MHRRTSEHMDDITRASWKADNMSVVTVLDQVLLLLQTQIVCGSLDKKIHQEMSLVSVSGAGRSSRTEVSLQFDPSEEQKILCQQEGRTRPAGPDRRKNLQTFNRIKLLLIHEETETFHQSRGSSSVWVRCSIPVSSLMMG